MEEESSLLDNGSSIQPQKVVVTAGVEDLAEEVAESVCPVEEEDAERSNGAHKRKKGGNITEHVQIPSPGPGERFTVVALYHFTPFENPAALRAPMQDMCEALGISGMLLLATEGINGTIAGSANGIQEILRYIRSLPGCSNLLHKESWASQPPFPRMKVKLKKEIVTLGKPNVNPIDRKGIYVEPTQWNNVVKDPNFVVIDTRNDYEVAIGTFENAVDPQTSSFRDFPAWWENNKQRFSGKSIAMFCTGGIRCEKSTSYLLSQGVEDVYHLKGGILKYLEEVPEAKSTWRGDCFVFDSRVSLSHGLVEGQYSICFACRYPILPEDTKRQEYEYGVACHHCFNETSEKDKARYRERQKQLLLTAQRNTKNKVPGNNKAQIQNCSRS